MTKARELSQLADITSVSSTELVFNETGADFDFRVESDTNTHALFVDAGSSEVGINTSTPGGALDVVTANNGRILIDLWGSQKQYYNGNVVSELNWTGSGDSWFKQYTNISSVNSLYNSLSGAGAIFNEDGADRDFRVESDANTHMLFVDAGAGHVNVGTSSDLGSTFNVNGTSRFTSRMSIGDVNYVFGASNYHIALLENSNDAYIGNIEGGGYMSGGGFYYGGGAWQLTGSATAISSVWTDPDGTVRFYNSSGGTAGSQISGYERFRVAPAEVVVNEISRSDTDFRVESDANSNAIFMDATTSTTCFGTGSANGNYRINVSGGILADGDHGLINDSNEFNFAHNLSVSTQLYINYDDLLSGSTIQSYGFYAGNGTTTFVPLLASAFTVSSDYRLKENVVALSGGIDRLKQLSPKRFTWVENNPMGIEPTQVVDGFLAHEVQSVIPEAVHGEKDAEIGEKGDGYQRLDQAKMVPLLTAALQEAVAKIETLEARIAALEAK